LGYLDCDFYSCFQIPEDEYAYCMTLSEHQIHNFDVEDDAGGEYAIVRNENNKMFIKKQPVVQKRVTQERKDRNQVSILRNKREDLLENDVDYVITKRQDSKILIRRHSIKQKKRQSTNPKSDSIARPSRRRSSDISSIVYRPYRTDTCNRSRYNFRHVVSWSDMGIDIKPDLDKFSFASGAHIPYTLPASDHDKYPALRDNYKYPVDNDQGIHVAKPKATMSNHVLYSGLNDDCMCPIDIDEGIFDLKPKVLELNHSTYSALNDNHLSPVDIDETFYDIKPNVDCLNLVISSSSSLVKHNP